MRIKILVSLLLLLSQFSFGQSAFKFNSSDTALLQVFNWAKTQALKYKGNEQDPVGPWYEGSLPKRNAFCIRDISHQSIGAEILNMHAENKNMISKFVGNISESKKWCTYWEIDKWDRPSPFDYKNDQDFWYNLNANFELIYACHRLYNWTGDQSYIDSSLYTNFFEKSLNEYVQVWKLDVDSLLNRPNNLNKDSAVKKMQFEYGYGLPSYVESIPNVTMSADLIAAIYAGYKSYGEIQKLGGNSKKSRDYITKAAKYYQHLDSLWWSKDSLAFYTSYSNDKKFARGEGEVFLLWFDIVKDTSKVNLIIKNLISKSWNIENSSYFPYLLYTNGYWDKAYEYLKYCSGPRTPRREYPEASYGVIEGIVQGLMGVCPNAPTNEISTVHRTLNSSFSEMNNLHVLGTSIDLKHESNNKSILKNVGTKEVVWKPCFYSKNNTGLVNNKRAKLNYTTDDRGKKYSYISIKVKPKETVTVNLVK